MSQVGWNNRVVAALDLTLLAGPSEVSVDTTATGKTLATLLGAALQDDLRVLTLLPAAAGISWASGEATAGVNLLPETGLSLRIKKAQADLLKFIVAAATIKMTVLQGG